MLTIEISSLFGLRYRTVCEPYLDGIMECSDAETASYALGEQPNGMTVLPHYPVPAIRHDVEYSPFHKDLSIHELDRYGRLCVRFWYWENDGTFHCCSYTVSEGN